MVIFTSKWDQTGLNENEQYLHYTNKKEWYLQYMKESERYCNMHIFKIYLEMTENEQENIIYDR
jgi:hypothetical protein